MSTDLRTRSSLLTFATMLVYTATTMATGLVASPRIERWLGPERFGAFRVVLDAQGYLALLELGLGGALSPLLARALGRGDVRALRATTAAGVRAYLRVSAAMIVVGLALTPVIARLAPGLDASAAADLRGAWTIGLLGFVGLATVPFRAIVEARQQGYLVNLVLSAQAVLVTAMALVLAGAGWGIVGQSLAVVIGSVAFSMAMAAVVLRGDRGMLSAPWRAPADAETSRALRGLGASAFLINLSGRVSLMTDNLVVGGVLGAGAVTTLFFSQRLAVLGQTLLQAIGGATWAALAELHARGAHETFNRRLVELSRLVAVLSVAGLAPVVAYNRHFVALWMGPRFPYGGDAVIVVTAINAALLAQASLWAWCFSATGQMRRVVVPSVASAALNLASSVVLAHRLGIVGPPLGTTVALIAITLPTLPWQLRRTFGTPLGPLVRGVAVPLACGATYAVVLRGIAHHHRPAGWIELAAGMGLAATVPLALAAAALLIDPEGRALWRARLRTFRPGVGAGVAPRAG